MKRTYFIQDGYGAIKIGLSTNISTRLAELQTCNSTDLKVLGYVVGNIESELHNRFSKDKIHGEWFKPSNEILDYVKTLKKYDPKRQTYAEKNDLVLIASHIKTETYNKLVELACEHRTTMSKLIAEILEEYYFAEYNETETK